MDIETDKGKEDAITRAFEYLEYLEDPLHQNSFFCIISDQLKISLEDLQFRKKAALEHLAVKKNKEITGQLLQKLNRLNSQGESERLIEEINKGLIDLKGSQTTEILTPFKINELRVRLKNAPELLKTDYKSLDKHISIHPGALSIIAGRPSHGKTTMLMNLLVNMVENYPEKSFFFFSYEESSDHLTIKVINILCEREDDSPLDSKQINLYLKFGRTDRREIEDAIALYSKYAEENRLWMIHTPYYVDELCRVIFQLSRKYDVGAIFIDYIQKIKIKGRLGTRQLELQKVSEKLLEMATQANIPIILGAQLGRGKGKPGTSEVRLDNLREAGDIEQDANLILGLHNKHMTDQESNSSSKNYSDVHVDNSDLLVHILKNRNGITGKQIEMNLNGPSLKITEKAGVSKRIKL